MASEALLPLPRQVFYDQNGVPLAGGFVYTYVPGGTTPKTTWQDSAGTTPNSNPIVLDAGGSALIYGSGTYQLTVTDADGGSIPAYSGVTATFGGSTPIGTVATVVALRASTGTPPIQQIWVGGYFTIGDGGEGNFWYNASDTTSADNGGTIIVDASGNRWYRQTEGNVSVIMFGALGADADYTTAIQNTYTYASSLPSGCIVQWPAGIYGISAPIAITGSNISSVGGPGRGSVRIMLLSATANLFDIDGSGVSFSGFTIDGHLTYTDGILFNYWGGPSGNGGGGAGLEDITSIAGFRVAEFTGNLAANIFIDNCIFDNCASNGIYFGPQCGGFVQVSNVQMDTPESINATGVGITIQAGGTYLFSNVNVSGFYTAWRISTVSGGLLTDVYCVNCLGDGTVGVRRVTGTYGWDIDGSGGGFGSLGRIGLVNCWAGSMPSDGFSIQVAYDVSLTDARAYGNSGHGIHLKDANSIDAVVITAAKCGSNSWLSPGTYSGIQVDDGVGAFQINGGWFGPVGNMPNTQAYGIAITGTSHNNYFVVGTYTGGNLSGGLIDQGTGPTKAVANNL